MRISDWSSTCALPICQRQRGDEDADIPRGEVAAQLPPRQAQQLHASTNRPPSSRSMRLQREARCSSWVTSTNVVPASVFIANSSSITASPVWVSRLPVRSEEHTSELQSLMRISYAVFCLK